MLTNLDPTLKVLGGCLIGYVLIAWTVGLVLVKADGKKPSQLRQKDWRWILLGFPYFICVLLISLVAGCQT
jgi:hypothetical protein